MRRSAAHIVREYGPFRGVENVAGVTWDGRRVWFGAVQVVQPNDASDSIA